MALSSEFPVKLLCETMGIRRSSFYSWKKHMSDPSDRTKNFVSNILLFQEYHLRFPSHGYRWLNAKIRLDTGLVLSGFSVARVHFLLTSALRTILHIHVKVNMKGLSVP